MRLFIFTIFISNVLLGTDLLGVEEKTTERTKAVLKVDAPSHAQYLLHMMWIANEPQNYKKISDIIDQAYEWANVNSNIHVIAWHNNPERKHDILFPREPHVRPLVTLRHISSLYASDILAFIETLPCSISRYNESLSRNLAGVLPKLLNNETTLNVYSQCDLIKILLMFWQAKHYPKKIMMCADLTIKIHKISDLCLCYQSSLEKFGIIMANMDFPKDEAYRAAMIKFKPDHVTLVGTAPGFENAAFLANCSHTDMLSVMGATLLRPIGGYVIHKQRLNEDHELIFFQMIVSFFYLNLIVDKNEQLFIQDKKSLFTAAEEDFIGHLPGEIHCQEHAYIPADSQEILLGGTKIFETYKKQDLLRIVIVETVIRGGFVQDMHTGEIIKHSLTFVGKDKLQIKKHLLEGLSAPWYNVGDLPYLAAPIMDKHVLLTKESHFVKCKEAQAYQ